MKVKRDALKLLSFLDCIGLLPSQFRRNGLLKYGYILLGGALPGEILSHGLTHHGLPYLTISKGFSRPADRDNQFIFMKTIELESCARRVSLIGIDDRILEAPGGSHDRNSPVPKAEHLGQATGLVKRWHEEHITSCKDLVGEDWIKPSFSPNRLGCWAWISVKSCW